MTPEAFDPPRRELRQLTGLRIVAALWVVLFHFESQYARLLPEIGGVVWITGSRGFLAVDLFFVLSGYILAYQHMQAFSEGRGRYGTFLLKRLARIYPVHLATLVFLALVVLVGARVGVSLGKAEHFTLEGAVQDLLLVRGWFWPSQGWNYPAWSLSAEWLAYLLFPVICLAIARVAHPRRSALVVVILALVAVEGVGAAALPWADQMPVAPLRVLAAFSCGVALFRLTEHAPATTAKGWSGLLILGAFIVGTPFLPEGPVLAGMSLAVAVLIIGALATGSGRAVEILGSRPLEYGGRISFSIYMTHGIVLLLSPVRFLGIDEVEAWPLPARVGIALAQLLVVLGAGALLYHLVERPGQRLVMSSTSGRTTRRT
jgi:peptidoglycan/LPS O-acetylase OafA/YrhL